MPSKRYFLDGRGVRRINRGLAKLDKVVLGNQPIRRRRNSSGKGIGNHYQITKGYVSYPTPEEDDKYCTITDVVEYEQFAKLPTEDPVLVKIPIGTELTEGDALWAVYHKKILAADPENGVPQDIDWEMLPSGATQGPPLRAFELLEDKLTTDSLIAVTWLNDDGSLTDEIAILHDPFNTFHGRSFDYYDGNEYYYDSEAIGNRGYALLRRDMNDYEPVEDHWEIVEMEGFVEVIVVEWYDPGSPVTAGWILADWGDGDPWANKPPVPWIAELVIDENYRIPILDPAGILPSGPELTPGMRIVARLADPDTTPPSYIAISSFGNVGPPLRKFEITQDKLTTDEYVTANWLADNDDWIASGEVTLHDPMATNSTGFHGRTTSYYSGSEEYEDLTAHGNRGLALLIRDLNPEYPEEDHWEIIAMEGFYKEVTLRWHIIDEYTAGWVWNTAYKNHPWDHMPPVPTPLELRELEIYFLTVVDPADMLPDEAVRPEGLTIVSTLADPDASLPTFTCIEVKQFTFIRGLAVEAVTSTDGTIIIDTVKSLSNGLDPTAGDAAAHVIVINEYEESYAEDEVVYAVWRNDSQDWEAWPKGGGGGDVLIVLIDADIPGVVEEDPDIEIDGLLLYMYTRTPLDLKYFVEVKPWDEGYEEGKTKMMLATVEDTEYGYDYDYEPDYDTQRVFYDDGHEIKVGVYTKSDYGEEVGENDEWPPEGYSEDYFNGKFRGICTKDANGNWVLHFKFCKKLPPPPVDTGS